MKNKFVLFFIAKRGIYVVLIAVVMAESYVVFRENDTTEKSKSMAVSRTSPIFRCDDVYILESTQAHGESTITFPSGMGSFELYDCKVLLCDDGCDPDSVVSRAFWGYAAAYPLEFIEEYTASDVMNYPTRVYLCTVPEKNLKNMMGTPEQIEAYGNRRIYLYLMTLAENLYAYIAVQPNDEDNALPMPENEQQSVDTLIASAEITLNNTKQVDPDIVWQDFLDNVVAPYSDYIVATEFLDLDGNGIDELIIYDWGASANCGVEIFTIENGEVRSFFTGTNVITHYDDEAKSLAPPSANANNFVFWGLPSSYADKSDTVLWCTPCTNRKGQVLYSQNGSSVHISEDYYYFTSDENGCLTVELLQSFLREAIDSNPENGWNCSINGEKVTIGWFCDTMTVFRQDLAVSHGVQYHEDNTASNLDELEPWREEVVEEIVPMEEPNPDWLVSEDDYTLYTREEWIQYKLYTDFGFREPVDVTALTDSELETYISDAYCAARDIFSMYYIDRGVMYGIKSLFSETPSVTMNGNRYNRTYNPVFPTLAVLQSYMNGILSHELTNQLIATEMFIDYEGQLYGLMASRGTNISKRMVGISITSRTDTEIIYTAEVEVREYDLGAEEPDYVEYHDFIYALTDEGWRWTDFHLYN